MNSKVMMRVIKMKITKRQLRRIIKEAIGASDISTFGDGNIPLYHPLLKGDYAGNGYSTSLFMPIMDWLDDNKNASEHTKLLHAIVTGKVKGLSYVPFKFGDEVIKQLGRLGVDRSDIEDIEFRSMLDDYEYQVRGADY